MTVTAWWMFTQLGRDEVFMAPHMYHGVLAISVQGWIQGRAKIGHRGPPLKKRTFSSDWRATATNRMHSNDLWAGWMKCCWFWFHSEVKFFDTFIVLSERQWPFGPLIWYICCFYLDKELPMRYSEVKTPHDNSLPTKEIWNIIFADEMNLRL